MGTDKLAMLQDELDNEKQARGEAVELKLKVLDDKLIRAQVSEEEKLKPLHDNVATVTENLAVEQKNREGSETSLVRILEDMCSKMQNEVHMERKTASPPRRSS